MITTVRNELKKKCASNEKEWTSRYSEELLDYKFSAGDYFEQNLKNCDREESYLVYKRTLEMKSKKEIVDIIPKLKDTEWYKSNDQPYFCRELETFAQAIREKKQIALEGGPCLFGLDEVTMRIVMRDGSFVEYDYSTGRQGKKEDITFSQSDSQMFDLIERRAKEIVEIRFVNNKKAITTDEYHSLRILFDLANALDAPVFIPIPDMSYQKYLEFISVFLTEDVRRKSREQLKRIVYEICDIYLTQIKMIAREFPNIRYVVLHERNEEILDKFYERRKPFFDSKKTMHMLTNTPVRMEPIKDYIAMPALPYYIEEIEYVLQVDCIDETDSYRKCKKAHKSKLNLSCMLYPEPLCEDGENIMFMASSEWKRYVE